MKKYIFPIVVNNKLTNIEATSLMQAIEISKLMNKKHEKKECIHGLYGDCIRCNPELERKNRK